MKQYYQCKEFSEFADLAARNEKERFADELKYLDSIEFNDENIYKNAFPNGDALVTNKKSNINILDDQVELYYEMTRKDWVEMKAGVISKNEYKKRYMSNEELIGKIDDIAKKSYEIKLATKKLSEKVKKPVVVIFNARSATIFSYAFTKDVEIECDNDGSIKSTVIILRDFKISSREYVQTYEEAIKLSGDPLTKFRPNFNSNDCYINESIPDEFFLYLKQRLPIIFVDVPSWGKIYASSTGLIRKKKDIVKKQNGICSPYKFRSYMKYAKYQISAVSLYKLKNWDNCSDEEHLILPEEKSLFSLDYNKAFCIIINPDENCNVWWDNCPQILSPDWYKYSDDKDFADFIRQHEQKIRTNKGYMNLYEFVEKYIQDMRGIEID